MKLSVATIFLATISPSFATFCILGLPDPLGLCAKGFPTINLTFLSPGPTQAAQPAQPAQPAPVAPVAPVAPAPAPIVPAPAPVVPAQAPAPTANNDDTPVPVATPPKNDHKDDKATPTPIATTSGAASTTSSQVSTALSMQTVLISPSQKSSSASSTLSHASASFSVSASATPTVQQFHGTAAGLYAPLQAALGLVMFAGGALV